jgi:hypothetical protein
VVLQILRSLRALRAPKSQIGNVDQNIKKAKGMTVYYIDRTIAVLKRQHR